MCTSSISITQENMRCPGMIRKSYLLEMFIVVNETKEVRFEPKNRYKDFPVITR
jgi:hypothetical protein